MFFHAHPDDEAIATGGTMAKAVVEGHRVVVVFATRGEMGEVEDGYLSEGAELGAVRTIEAHAAAGILGLHRVEFLGYRDSGMMGEESNNDVDCFWRADVDEAAGRLANILEDEGADVLTVYDDHGGYGHPDHIQVHLVGHRAGEIAGTARVYEATINRDAIERLRAAGAGPEDEGSASDDAADEDSRPNLDEIGTPDPEITAAVDVAHLIDAKRRAMAAHASQINERSWFFTMPEAAFAAAFGTEWFIRKTPPFTGDTVADRENSII